MPKQSKPSNAKITRWEDFVMAAQRHDVLLDLKKLPCSYATLLQENVCIFCFTKETNADKYGSFIHHKQSGIWIHYFCLLLASGLKQRCKDSEIDQMETGHSVYGFLIKDILEEFKRASKLKCTHCYKPGATIGCSIAKCKSKFHFSCGLNRNVLFQYFGSFESYCKAHKCVQNQLLQKESCTEKCIVKKCCMCLENVQPSIDNTIIGPCCKTWFHKLCVQNQALSAGRYYFRCPACNNKDEYANEMLTLGIYVPDRDASWETPEAYQDLLGQGIRCDVQDCKCLKGRTHDQSGTKWAIVACLLCGGFGSHLFCNSLKSTDSPFVCEICLTAQGQYSARKMLRRMGFKAEDLQQLPISMDLVQCDKRVTRQSTKRKSSETTSPNKALKHARTSTPTIIRKSSRQRRATMHLP